MVGENGQPETPDWRCEPRAPVFDLVSRVKAKLEALDLPDTIFLGEN